MFTNRWFMLAMLVLARLAIAFQFQSAGSVAPLLAEPFGIEYAGTGLLVGMFMLPGVVLSLPAGGWGRRYGDKRMVVLGLAVILAGSLLCAAASDFPTLLAGRLVVGAGSALLAVLLNKMLTDWFADRELYLGMSLFIVTWPVGIAAAQVVQPALAAVQGWSAAFVLAAGLTAAALALFAAFYRPPPKRPDVVGGAARLSGREIRLICIAGANWLLINCAFVLMLTFGPALLIERGTTVAHAGAITSAMSWVAIVALPAGGLLAGRVRSPDTMMIAALAVAVATGALLPVLPLPAVSFAVYGVSLGIATAVVAALPAQMLRPEVRGAGFGIYYLWYFVGALPLVALGGVVADLAGSAAAAIWFGAALLVATIAMIGWLRFEQARQTAAA